VTARRAALALALFVATAGCDDGAARPVPAPPPAASAAASAAPSARASAASPAPKSGVSLEFREEGRALRAIPMERLTATIAPEVFTAFDPYYGRAKTFRALAIGPVLAQGFAGTPDLAAKHFVLRALDGYTVPLEGKRLLEGGAYLAIDDVDVPGFEPIGPRAANPAPFYLVWKNPDQQDLETHPRPWQLASIEIASFESTFPLTVPEGEPEGSPARRGFSTFREQCIHCHAMNQQGGKIGPDLNVPQSIVDYRPEPQIRAYIRDPRTFRYSTMPAHPHLGEPGLDELVAYFRVMSRHKHDPAAKAPPKP
jgi:mono/diheme cytochrome c family protein